MITAQIYQQKELGQGGWLVRCDGGTRTFRTVHGQSIRATLST